MHSYSLRVGNFELVSLADGAIRPAPTNVFPDTDISDWKSEFPCLLDNDDNSSLRLGTLAVRSNGKLLIVDTGMQNPDGSGHLLRI